MFDKMKQLMEMKKQADAIKKELEAISVNVEEVRGIKIRINGAQKFKELEIDSTMINPDNKQRFENDLLRCMNAAIKKSQAIAAEKMKSVMPDMGF
ncbi:MAG: YbaB/EbfC family nucleoid-associated protein [Candidatus Omnitrophica bacterium]|nr:YbaB/EbfC family nucleoid-associated protein [Candidatus Omnitrophota bacterium]